MQEIQKKRQNQINAKKEYHNTNGGPTFTEEQQKAVDERMIAQTKLVKLALTK